MTTSGMVNIMNVVELVAGEKVGEWSLKKYKTVEMAVARSMRSPLPGNLKNSTS